MSAVLDYRSTRMRDLTEGIARLTKKALRPIGVALGAISLYLYLSGQPGAAAFAMISVGTVVALATWTAKGIGVPLVPMILIQQIFLYAVPILVNPGLMAQYPESIITSSGLEVLVYSLAFAGSWAMAMNLLQTGPAICYALTEFKKDGAGKLRTLSLALIFLTTGYTVLDRMGLIYLVVNALPAGSSSIVTALLAAAATCGFFIGSLLIGSNEMPPGTKGLYWLMLGVNCYIAASSFLLSSACTFVMSVVIGLFWSSGKVPWKLLIILGIIFSFLNVGKDAMRDRYWRANGTTNIPDFKLSEMPGHYAEWIQSSTDAITGGGKIAKQWEAEIGQAAAAKENQTLLARVNNLQNLLYVIDAETVQHIVPLQGGTYSIIPLLLVPRILLNDKPRSHEGQVMLNVHFQRQDLNSTFETYIAWGLVPEAYGNFGPFTGSIILGVAMGLLFAFLEKWTADKLVVSLEGFIGFTIFLGIANSYEMVASVLVTSVFQALVPVAGAMLPFSRRTQLPPRTRVGPQIRAWR
jgi:hypothetical protein